MLAVLDTVKHVFWNDLMYDRNLLPSESTMENSDVSILDLSTMKGCERVELLAKCNIHSSLFPVFLRAIQHITAVQSVGSIDDGYSIHRHVSAHKWSPFNYCEPILGYPISHSEPFQEIVSNTMENLSSEAPDGSRRAEDQLLTGLTVKSGNHYNGLLNQGATCYLNSLLQALFHISQFRLIIYSMPTKEEVVDTANQNCESNKKSIPYALQRLFCKLQTSCTAVGTKELTESFGWSASDSFTQHDVHEMTRVLLDNLEEKLNVQHENVSPIHSPISEFLTLSRPTQDENEISKLFHGCLESYVSVEEIGYYGSREETFYDIQLVVKNTRNIYASLDAFFQVEILDGKNKYCLEQNGQKSYHRAEKGVRFKKIPPIMLFHLARFDYDVEQGETKVLTRWDYYSTLNLAKYMPHASATETHYTLYSVLVHSGSNTGFGHYFCFIKCAGEWFKFNDEHVAFASLRQVFGDNFGGFQMNYWGSEVPYTANAYMLIYVRTSEMQYLLRPVNINDVPQHVMQRIKEEEQEREKLEKERAEEHLYARVYFAEAKDVLKNYEGITSITESISKLSLSHSLRVRRNKEALPLFQEYITTFMNLTEENSTPIIIWYAPESHNTYCKKFELEVRKGMSVEEIASKDAECIVLVTSKRNTPFIDLRSSHLAQLEPSAYDTYQLLLHKLYDPLSLKIFYIGMTVISNSFDVSSKDVIHMLECDVRKMIEARKSELDANEHEINNFTCNSENTEVWELPGETSELEGTDKAKEIYILETLEEHNKTKSNKMNMSEKCCYDQVIIDTNNTHNVDNNDDINKKLNVNTKRNVENTTCQNDDHNENQNKIHNDVFDKLFESCGVLTSSETKTEKGTNFNINRSTEKNNKAAPLRVMMEVGNYKYEPCNKLHSGDILVWQEEPLDKDLKWIFYPDVMAFQHFIKHCIPVEIKLNAPPLYETLVDVKLADDMTYEQLQLYVARLIGKHDEYDYIRFTRHNPETGLPYFMKGRKKERPTLTKLLTPATSRITTLSKYLYYEVCKYTVTEIENSHSLQFKLYADNTKPISSHWVIMPREIPITVLELFTICLREIKHDLDKHNLLQIPEEISKKLFHTSSSDDLSTANSNEFIKYILDMTNEQAWNELRLVDVWRGRIYNLLDKEHTIRFENDTFEESAEYRIERRPDVISNIPLSEQIIIPVCHFCLARNRKDAVETHSEPFSMYISSTELPDSLLHRIAAKLEISYATVADWKVCLVRENRVQQLKPEQPIRFQMRTFCREEYFEPNQREPLKAAFIGLEHAPVAKRANRRDEKVIILK